MTLSRARITTYHYILVENKTSHTYCAVKYKKFTLNSKSKCKGQIGPSSAWWVPPFFGGPNPDQSPNVQNFYTSNFRFGIPNCFVLISKFQIGTPK